LRPEGALRNFGYGAEDPATSGLFVYSMGEDYVSCGDGRGIKLGEGRRERRGGREIA
jgi:hypothetical protein